jgi:hypothetical protein
MNKPATTISLVFLTMVAAAHVVRFVAAWPVNVDSMSIPVWFSGVAAVVVGALAALTFLEQRRA